MSKCQTCRKNDAELLTWWERARNWKFIRLNSIFFTQDFQDLKSEMYTKGFADGMERGGELERKNQELMHARFPEPTVDIEGAVRKRMDELLSPIDTNKIVAFDKSAGAIIIGGERVDDSRLANLKSEAEALEQFDLWRLLHETPKELAQRALFVEGDTSDQLRKGRTMLYTLSTQQRIMDTLKSYVPKK